MKKVGRMMGLLMALTLSLVLSFVGVFTSGQFTVPGFLISFLISFVISLLIGLVVPMPKVNMALGQKMHLQPGSLRARLVESLVSNLIYTPLITVSMVTLAWMNIRRLSGGHQPPYVPMLLRSLAISLVVAYLLIFLVSPVYLRLSMKKYGVPQGGAGKPQA